MRGMKPLRSPPQIILSSDTRISSLHAPRSVVLSVASFSTKVGVCVSPCLFLRGGYCRVTAADVHPDVLESDSGACRAEVQCL